MFNPNWYKVIACFIAAVYFFSQVELDQEEYERNHPIASDKPAFTSSSLNWESFDKENVRKAFSCSGAVQILFLFCFPQQIGLILPVNPPYRFI